MVPCHDIVNSTGLDINETKRINDSPLTAGLKSKNIGISDMLLIGCIVQS